MDTQKIKNEEKPSVRKMTLDWHAKVQAYAEEKRRLMDSGKFDEDVHQELIKKHGI